MMKRTVLMVVFVTSVAFCDAPKPIGWDVVADSPVVFLARLDKAGAGLEPGPRLVATGGEAVVLAAASAVALGGDAVAEWGPKLYGEGTDGERAFAIAAELVGGNYTRLLDLPVALGMMEREQKRTIQWQEIAAALEQAAGTDATRTGWRNAAVALRMVALWRSARNPQQQQEQLAAFIAAGPAAKQGIADAIANATGKYVDRAKNQYFMILREGFSTRRLTDPVLAGLLVRIAPDPRAVAAITQVMGNRAPTATEAMAHAQAQVRGDNPEAVCHAAVSLSQVGKRDEAIQLLRDAEARFGYPDRQQIRRQLFGMLRGPRAPQLPGMPPQQRQPSSLAQFPALAKEWEERQATAGVTPAELALVKADLYGAVPLPKEAATALAEAFGLATEPAAKVAAWEGWAAYDPKAAWAEADTLDGLFANVALPPPALARLACRMVAAGLLADDLAGVQAWSAKRSETLATTRDGRHVPAILVLWQALAPATDAAVPVPPLATGLAGLTDDGRFWLVRSLLQCPRLPIVLTGEDLDRKLTEVLRSRLEASGGWEASLNMALAAVPCCQGRQGVAELWQEVMQACPPLGEKALTDDEQTAETARQEQLAVLTGRCLVGLDSVEHRLASNVGREYLSAAAAVVNDRQGKRFLPHAQALLAGTLAQAGKLDLSGRSVTRNLQGYAAGLTKCGATAAEQTAFRECVRKTFPEDRDIAQLLATLEAAVKP